MPVDNSQPLIARIEPLPELAELRLLWGQMTPDTGASFFTSWDWIESWLLELRSGAKYRLLRICRNDATVAVAILVFANVRRHNRLLRRVVHLHATGDSECDSVRIEQNDILSREPLVQNIYDAALHCLFCLSEKWDELDLQGVANGQAWINAAQRYNMLIETEVQNAPRVVFSDLLNGRPLWEAVKGVNDRYALRRSLRDYTRSLGELQVIEPADPEEALKFLEALTRLHDTRWRSQGVQSPFLFERAQRFHARLVTCGFANRRARICKVMAGQSIVGYVYLLIQDGVANFYQSGFDYHLLDKRNQPGWLCLQLVIEMLRSEGLHSFEFLAGDEPYKRRLATAFGTNSWLKLTRPFARYRLEHAAVSALRSFRSAGRHLIRTEAAIAVGTDPKDAGPL